MINIHLDFNSILCSRYLVKSEFNIALKLALNAALKLALHTDYNKKVFLTPPTRKTCSNFYDMVKLLCFCVQVEI